MNIKIRRLKGIMHRYLFLLFLCVFTLFSCAGQPQNADVRDLFKVTDRVGFAGIERDNSFVSGINVSAALSLLSEDSFLRVPLPKGGKIIIQRKELKQTKNSSFWTGKVKDDPTSLVY